MLSGIRTRARHPPVLSLVYLITPYIECSSPDLNRDEGYPSQPPQGCVSAISPDELMLG